MTIRYSVKSNENNKLIERTYYKKKSDIFYIEKTQSEFNIVSANPLEFTWSEEGEYIQLFEYEDIAYGHSSEKLFFTSGISIDDKKSIKKLSKGYRFEDEIKSIGWKFFDKTSKVTGESKIERVPFNQLSLQATEIEISCLSISDDEFKEYLKNGISSEEYDDISTSGDSGFCETDSKFTVNDEEVDIKKHLLKELKKKSSDEQLMTKMQLPALIVAHYFKRSHATIDIFEEFDLKKLTLNIEKYIYKSGPNGYYFAYRPTYGDEDFSFESSGLHNYTDILLIDTKGKVYSIDVLESDDEDEDGDDD
jgi:hypothetical protein